MISSWTTFMKWIWLIQLSSVLLSIKTLLLFSFLLVYHHLRLLQQSDVMSSSHSGNTSHLFNLDIVNIILDDVGRVTSHHLHKDCYIISPPCVHLSIYSMKKWLLMIIISIKTTYQNANHTGYSFVKHGIKKTSLETLEKLRFSVRLSYWLFTFTVVIGDFMTQNTFNNFKKP